MHRRRGSAYHLLKLVEDSGEVGFWWLDLETGRIDGSVGLLRITGLMSDTELHALFADLVHPDDRAMQADILDILQRGHPVSRTFRIVRPDRSVRWVRLKGQVVLGPAARPIRAEGVLFDVTLPQEATLLAEENRLRYQNLTRALAAAEWTASPQGQRRPSASWQALTGQAGPDQQGDGWQAVLHPDDRAMAAGAWQEALIREGTLDTDFRLRCADGLHRRYNCRVTPLRDGRGHVVEWLGILLLGLSGGAGLAAAAGQPLPDVTPALVRAARALLDWSAPKLAAAAGVSLSSVKRFEAEGMVRDATRRAIREALEGGGIRFHRDPSGEAGVLAAKGAAWRPPLAPAQRPVPEAPEALTSAG